MKIALADTAFSVLSHLGYVAEAQINSADRPAEGNHVFGTFGCDFSTSDGRRVMVTAFTPRHWRALIEATGTAHRFNEIASQNAVDFNKEEERYAMRHIIEEVLTPWFSERSLLQISQALDSAGACWGPYQTVRQALKEDPDLSTANPMIEEIHQPGIGTCIAAGSPVNFSGIPRSPVEPAPILGCDTVSVLSDKLGLSESDINDLRGHGVI